MTMLIESDRASFWSCCCRLASGRLFMVVSRRGCRRLVRAFNLDGSSMSWASI